MEALARDYSMSDSELTEFTGTFIDVLTENLSDLAEYGLTSLKIDALETLADAFDAILPDDFYAAAVSEAVIERNAKRKEIAAAIQSVMVRIANVIPHKYHRYNRFTAKALKDAANHAFRDAADDFAEYAAADLAALTGEGVSQALLDAIDASAAAFTTLAKAVRNAQRDRADIAQQRVEKGNELYAAVKKYADYGKDKFKNNPAKYNLFILYADAGIPQTPPVAPAIAEVDGFIQVIFPQNVTSAHIEIRTEPDGEFTEFYDGENQPVEAPEDYDYLEVSAFGRNAAGNGAVTTKVFHGAPPAPENFRREGDSFMWDVDESVEEVELDASYDNGASYNQIGIIAGGTHFYTWTPPSGTVVLRLRSKRNGMYSPYVLLTVVIP